VIQYLRVLLGCNHCPDGLSITISSAYPLKPRRAKKILSAWENKENTQRGIAKRFKVSLSFVRDFLRRYRETNEIAAKPQGGDRRSKIKGKDEELVKTIVEAQNDIYLREIKEKLHETKTIEVSVSGLSRTLKRLELGRKKKL
jgi:transposase